jgi:(2R)-sulfolactate sulfo-lyase subunit alpha
LTSKKSDSRLGFLIHAEGDHVGVAVEDVNPGKALAVYMDSHREDSVDVTEAIPLGHKVALADIAPDADVIEYGVRVGRTRAAIKRGQLVHVHNIRSARWDSSR